MVDVQNYSNKFLSKKRHTFFLELKKKYEPRDLDLETS